MRQLRAARRGRARRYVTAITLSEPQAALARERAAAAGLADRIEIRIGDYRDLAGEQFDAIASIGMVEHVGSANIDAYARQLATVLRPGGRLLNHGIARLRYGDPEAGPFSERYVFPDAAPLHLSRVLTAIEAAGLEPTHVEGFPQDYARTLREWARKPRRAYRPCRIARRPGADAPLATVPARRATRVRKRLHVDLPDRRPPPAGTPPNPPLRATAVNRVAAPASPPMPDRRAIGRTSCALTAKPDGRKDGRPTPLGLQYRFRRNRPRRTARWR